MSLPEEQKLPGCWVHGVGQCPDTCTSIYESTVALEIRRLMPGYFITYEYQGYIHVQRDTGDGDYISLAFNFNTPLTWEWAWMEPDGNQTENGDDIQTDPTLSPVAMAEVIVNVLRNQFEDEL